MNKFKLGIIATAVILIVAVIIITVMGMDSDRVVKSYYSLSNRPYNSARQFKIPFGYITVNSDGTINIEFASSISTISNNIGVGDGSSDSASGDDDRQGGGTGTGTKPNPKPGGPSEGGGGTAEPPVPDLSGNELIFPPIGSDVWYKEINTKKEGVRKRVAPDSVSWEFAWGYISTNTNPKFQTMRRRASKIAPYVQNGGSHDALKVNLGGESYYVGCLPISGFGSVGDIIEFTFDNGNSIKVLAIDAKSADDKKGTGSSGQCNTKYCHAILSGSDLRLSAIELWCGGDKTANGNRSTMPSGNVTKAKIVGHWGGF